MMYITQNYPVIDVRLTGQRIQNLMKERGIKPTEVQDWLSLSCVQTVYRWMKGISVPSIDNLYALSHSPPHRRLSHPQAKHPLLVYRSPWGKGEWSAAP